MTDNSPRPRRVVDGSSLFVAFCALLASGYLVSGGEWTRGTDPRWLVAGAAVLAGLILFGSSLVSRQRG